MSFTVEVDGKRVDDKGLLSEFRVHRRLSLPTQCEIVLLLSPNEKWQTVFGIGKQVRIRVSKPFPDGTLFEGKITGQEFSFHADESTKIRVRAYDALVQLRRKQLFASHVDCTLQGLASKLLQSAGLLSISAKLESDINSPVWKRLIQRGTTNLKFLSDRCSLCGVYFYLNGKTLQFFTLGGFGTKIELPLISLLEADFELNGINSCEDVAVQAWNPRRGEVFQSTASQPRSARKAGGSSLASKLGGLKSMEIADPTAEDLSQAKHIAQGERDLRHANEFVFKGVTHGNAALCPGSVIDVTGFEMKELNASYVLTDVIHVYSSERGFVSELSTEVPITQRNEQSSFLLAKVSKVNDPDGLGRVQVTLPSAQDIETDWLQVVGPGLGKAKGLVALPNVGDSVIVVLRDDDSAQGVVLGSIFGSNKPKTQVVDGGSVSKYSLDSEKGLQILLDDSKGELSLGCENGGTIKISADGVTITGKSINLKKG